MFEWLINFIQSCVENTVSQRLHSAIDKAISLLGSNNFNPDVRAFFNSYNKKGVPFSNFELEPDNVSQIKKLINALYYLELSFQDLEKIDTSTIGAIGEHIVPLYTKTVHHAYLACQLLTHLDVDLRGIFTEELGILLPILTQIQNKAGNYTEEQKKIAQAIKDYPLSYNVGLVTGITVKQIKPTGGDLDYTFLTQFSGILPAYIQQATQLIQKYSSQLIIKQPTLNREKIEEYRNIALSLLNNLEDLKGNDLFVSLKLLNYISIINQVITLSMSILDQIGKLGNSSQDWIRDQLGKLKYEVLPTLFGLVDKIEDNTMLKPGTLSVPLMKHIEPLYQFLVHYSGKVVNFSAKGEELLTIEDSRFLSLRLEFTHKRIDEANRALVKIDLAQDASEKFYEILNKLPKKDQCLHELDVKTQNELLEYYKIFKPYLDQVDIDLSTALTKSLQGLETWTSWLETAVNIFAGGKPIDHISHVLARHKQLNQVIDKDRISKKFHNKLNENLIKSVYNQANLALFPHNNDNNIFTIDETKILGDHSKSELKFNNKILENPELLSSEQALYFYQWYKNKQNKLKIARVAYQEFIELTQGNPLQLKYADRTKARNLYHVFQECFVSGAPLNRRQEVLNCDKYLAQMFSIKKITMPLPSRSLFDDLNEHYQKYFTDTDLKWSNQSKKYLKLAEEKYQAEHRAQKLEINNDANARAHYLIKHTEYSKAIKEFRLSLQNIRLQFNQPLQQALTIKSPNTLPYPEVEDTNTILSQPKQVLAIKQIYNSLYHVEQIIYWLEQVKEVPDSEATLLRPLNELRNTVGYLILAYTHLNQIIKASKNLIKDPQLSLIGRDILEKAQTTLATLQEHTYAYGVPPPTTAPINETVKYNALWYVLNAVFVIPIHIRSLRNNNYISAEELNQLNIQAKQSTVTIETIIKNSGSYLRLFLLTPKMHDLYRNLKKKLYEFSSTGHDAVMHNLAEIQSGIFAPMLLEADNWEDRMGLSPGVISGPMKKMIEEYYKGLLYHLGLTSKKHISLICNKNTFTKRKELAQDIIKNSNNKIDNYEKKINHIKEFYDFLVQHEFVFKNVEASLWTDEFKQEAILKYQLCLPRLAKIQKKLNLVLKPNAADQNFDALLNATRKNYDPELKNIRGIAYATYHYYQGKRNTALLTLKTAEAKLNYLKDLEVKQVEEDLKFIEDYTTNAFERELNTVCNRHVGLQYMDKEYSKELRKYLLQFEQSIITTSKSANDINRSVQTLLHARASRFEKRRFAEFYHLDTVRSALAQFKVYLSQETANKHSLFEDDKTLNAKSERIRIVDEIASNADLSIDERFKQIKQNVLTDGSFKKVLCARKDTDFLSWTHLYHLFIGLLEAIHLYTSTRKRLSNDVTNAVSNKPQIKELINRFGLFSANQEKPITPTAPAIILPVPTLMTT